jgi:hypothetical protein
VDRLRPAATEVFRTAQVALFLCDNDEIKTIVNDIERQINGAVGVVSSHELTPAGFVEGIAALDRYRKAAGEKAGELLDVAHRLFDFTEPGTCGTEPDRDGPRLT